MSGGSLRRRRLGPRPGAHASAFFSRRAALAPIFNEEHYLPLLFGGKNRFGGEDRLNITLHQLPAKVRDILRLFQNRFAVGFVGA
jgi:hypothetical protein